MLTLDNDMIIDLQRAALQVEQEQDPSDRILGQCLLFAVKPAWRDGILLVANRHLLIEWPIELVDVTAPEYPKLLKAAGLEPERAQRLQKNRWDIKEEGEGGLNLREERKLFSCEEIPPQMDGAFSYRTTAGQVFHYSRHYRGMIERIWPPLERGDELVASVETKIWVDFGSKSRRGIMVIYENERRRAAIANRW